MILERFSYQTGEIIFPGIEMPARLSKGHYFRNYGIVPDLRQKSIQITQEIGIGINQDDLLEERYHNVAAQHIGFNKEGEIGSAICVREGLEKDLTAFNFGHESVHAIIYLGLQNQFVEFLRKEGFGLNPFETFSNEEDIANVGGLLSWHKRLVLWFYSHPSVDPIKKVLTDSRFRKILESY